jgi:uncharacterized membrane protein (DUF373 family)
MQLSDVQIKGARALARAEEIIYFTTAVLLVIAAAGLLVVAVWEMIGRLAASDYTGALLHLLDRALLVLMLVEVIYSVRRISQHRRLEMEPFFIIAIIAGIRRMLVITAESATTVNLDDPVFQAAMVELGLLALIILALAAALRIAPSRRTT